MVEQPYSTVGTNWCHSIIVAVTLARPLYASKVGQSKEKGKTKQATHISDFHAHGSKSSHWPMRLPWSWHRWRHNPFSEFRESIPHWSRTQQPGSSASQYCWDKTVPLSIFSTSKKQAITAKSAFFYSWKHASSFKMVFKPVPIKCVLKGKREVEKSTKLLILLQEGKSLKIQGQTRTH